MLGTVQLEFAKYAGTLAKVQKKLQEAANTVDDAARRTRVLEKTLRTVESGSEPPDLFEDDDAPALTRVAGRF